MANSRPLSPFSSNGHWLLAWSSALDPCVRVPNFQDGSKTSVGEGLQFLRDVWHSLITTESHRAGQS